MEGLCLNKLDIYSDKGTYELFIDIDTKIINDLLKKTKAIIVDKNILNLYKNIYSFNEEKLIIIDACEDKKTPQEALKICEQIMLKDVRRKDSIVAIGGGITQDLTTFATSILYRGINWIWLPTTLLAQADSCIGGKSSLNYKTWKNIIGNFYPPQQIIIQSDFLKTLHNVDIRSGIGEILKVHLLSGPESVGLIKKQLSVYNNDKSIISRMIYNSLKLKNEILKIDPLDQGLRLKMNYGHSFGHALEAASNFKIPHGIAVTIGLDIANFVAKKIGRISNKEFDKLHSLILSNLQRSDYIDFEFDNFIEALRRDKKNDSNNYNLIIPISYGEVELTTFPINGEIEKILKEYFTNFYKAVE
jgi:3-dehydroquinate synthase